MQNPKVGFCAQQEHWKPFEKESKDLAGDGSGDDQSSLSHAGKTYPSEQCNSSQWDQPSTFACLFSANFEGRAVWTYWRLV